jgi:hypothetical protein
MTPEEAFQKWLFSHGNIGHKVTARKAFLAGIQYQEMNQINCLYEIRKAVGDPEGRLMQSDLVERVKTLARPWRTIETAPKDGATILLYAPPSEFDGMPVAERITAGSWHHIPDDEDCDGESCWISWDGGFTVAHPPTHWMPLPVGYKSVTTEKEEA